jgi:hypothetical protein
VNNYCVTGTFNIWKDGSEREQGRQKDTKRDGKKKNVNTVTEKSSSATRKNKA